MEIRVRKYRADDLPAMIRIWNEVVEEGIAFPQEELLDMTSGAAFFDSQSYSAVAEDGDSGTIYGLYILHPNNVGRCGHISNASYAVSSESRGLHIGEKAGIRRAAIQCGRCDQYPCPASVRTARFCATGRHSGWFPYERRALRGYLSLLSCAVTVCLKAGQNDRPAAFRLTRFRPVSGRSYA